VSVLLWDESVPLLDYLSGFSFFDAMESYVYQVEPTGDAERDPAGGGHETFRRCASAEVLRRVYGPT
jgi:hypothetical protein